MAQIVDDTNIILLYNSYIAKHKTILDAELDAQRINSDLYAKALVSLLHQSMQLATQSVQQQPVLDAQVAKTEADTAFVIEQDTQLEASVTFNNKIKALDAYGDMIGTMGAGSLTIHDDMWTAFFNMVDDLNSSSGIPTNTTITKL